MNPIPWLRWGTSALLRCVVGREGPEISADLAEEAMHRADGGHRQFYIVCWWIVEVFFVIVHDIKDRLPQVARTRFSFGVARLKPFHALKLALRSLRHEPMSGVYGALALAVGFGAATANYSTLAGFTRPLPVPRGADVVRIQISANRGNAQLTIPEAHLLATQPVFGAAGIFAPYTASVAHGEYVSRRVSAAAVDAGVFRTLEQRPLLGRFPTTGLDPGSLVIGEKLWRGWLKGDPNVLGKHVDVNGVPHSVVAVMPAKFRFPIFQEIWTPLQLSSEQGFADLVARPSHHATRRGAAEVIERVLRADREARGLESDIRLRVLGFTEGRGEAGEQQGLTALLLIVVALVLVSCSNVSSLLYMRGTARARALSLHRALGATPGQIVVQQLADCALIPCAGAMAGFLVAWGLVTFLQRTLQPHWGFHWMDVNVQPMAVLFLGGLAIVTALLAGTFPALRASRSDILDPLKTETMATRGGSKSRGPRIFLTVQIALSSVALVGTIFLAAGVLGTRRADGGLDPNKIMHAGITLDGPRFEAPQKRAAFRRQLIQSLSASSLDVSAVSTGLPVLGGTSTTIEIAGRIPTVGELQRVNVQGISDRFFDVYQIDLISGRSFLPSDRESAAPVAIVNAGFTRRYLDGQDAHDRWIRLGNTSGDSSWVRIVGVVSDVILVQADRERDRAIVFRPLAQMDASRLIISARGPDFGVAETITSTVMELDGSLPLEGSLGADGLATLQDTLSYLLRLHRVAALLALLGGIGTLLVVTIGLYGVLAFEVQQRLPEFGVRLALGANRGRVLREVVTRGFRRVFPGLFIGFAVAWAVTPVFGVFLSRVNPHDARIFLGLLGIYLVITLVAAGAPGRRAAESDPASVLRGD